MSQYLHLMKLAMGRHPAVSTDVHLEVLIKVCKYYVEKDDAISYITTGGKLAEGKIDETNAVYISELSDEKDFFSLLLVRGDPGRTLPSFVNPKTRIVKPVSPQDVGDVPGASSHVIISKASIASGTDQGRHRMAIERTTGLSKTLARDFLTNLLARYADEFPSEFVAEKRRRSAREKQESIAYRPTVRFNPQQNASLKNDLESGKIGGFKLVRGIPNFKGEASAPQVQRVNVSLTAQIAPTEDFSKVRAAIDSMRGLLSSVEFEGLNLELIDEGGNHHNTRMLQIDQVEESDMRYCKTIHIADVGHGAVECYSELQKPFLKAAKAAIQNSKNWT
ncbi:hypothetical protein OE766_03685 [Pararhizobium sp. YC-54]|uniref:hypothetical protein n=1 Tax=Pararhizobium sp. YC-54 TaxID=2986920 RepID=UPI0021F75CBF|nr:hypothetical protein [Pararhizobium sp. YC-54]MCV9997339.1 hypothetical protein [Pararhizobium sp. YC-54]